MARARNIKPGFFKNDTLVEMSFETRLLFIGLWCIADREGRFEARNKKIKMELFPCDDVDVSKCIADLEAGGFLVQYAVNGKSYAQILNFTKHQTPHHKEVASEIPAPPGHDQITKHAYDVPLSVRLAIFERDENKCLRCGSVEELSIDHIHSLSAGGDNAPNNLQTLCKTCNSSKGGSTKDYRKINVGPTLDQRTFNHNAPCPTDSLIPDSGYLIPSSLIPDTLFLDSGEGQNLLPAGKPTRPKKQTDPENETALQAACRNTWAAYSMAYAARYGPDPVRNVKVNSLVKQVVQRLGAEEAPLVAAFFVGHANAFYVRKSHDLGSLVADAEKLRMEWASGRMVTATSAQQEDRTQSNFNAANEAVRILEEARA